MPDQIYVLAHQECGHICGCVGSAGRALLEQQRMALAAAGHRQWRIRLGADDDLAALLPAGRVRRLPHNDRRHRCLT